MKKLAALLMRVRVLRRLRSAETCAKHAAEAFDQVAKALSNIRVCIDCGAVQLLGHPKVGQTEAPGGAIEVRCQFHQQAYKASPAGKARDREVAQAKHREAQVH